MANELLAVRAQVKKRKPTYKRVQANQFAKFKNDPKWRRPKGMGNKDRRNRKGHIGMLKIGYGSPRAVRGLNRQGFDEVLVSNVADFTKVVEKTQIAVISATVGGKKKLSMLTHAKENNISIGNVKNIDETIKSLTKEKKVKTPKKVAAKKVEEKKETPKKEESKKSTTKKAEVKETKATETKKE